MAGCHMYVCMYEKFMFAQKKQPYSLDCYGGASVGMCHCAVENMTDFSFVVALCAMV